MSFYSDGSHFLHLYESISFIVKQLSEKKPLKEILTNLIKLIEKEHIGVLCSIYLVDGNKEKLTHIASNSLPEFYVQKLKSFHIGDGVGSCGTAVYRGELVVVENIQIHPYWEKAKYIAEKAGLKACWSYPIKSFDNNILGSFAMYYNVAKAPSEDEKIFIESMANIASVAIQQTLAYSKLKITEENIDAILENIQDIFYRTDIDGKCLMVSSSIYERLGFTIDEFIDKNITSLYFDSKYKDNFKQEFEKSGGKVYDFEAILEKKDHTKIWASINAQYYFDDKHNPIGIEGIIRDITNKKNREAENWQLKNLLESVLEESPFSTIVVSSPENNINIINKQSHLILDLDLKQNYNNRNFLDLINSFSEYTSECIPVLKNESYFKKAVEQEGLEECEFMIRTAKNVYKYIVLRHRSIFNQDGKKIATVIVFLDQTEKKIIENKQRQYGKVFDSVTEGIIITDYDTNIISVNPAFTEITGYKESEVIGKKPSILKSNQHGDDFYKNMWKDIIKNGKWHGEVYNNTKYGRVYPQLLTINAVKDDMDNVINYVASFTDITHLKESQKNLEYQANYDHLTSLPNRLLFDTRLKHSIDIAKRNDKQLAVFFIDLDRFKNINDSLGHQVGDEILVDVANRLKQSIRREDTLSRIGGDEFILVMEDYKKPLDAITMAQKILDVLRPSFIIGEYELYLSASIGISLYPKDGDDEKILIKNADAAMYSAKENGKNNFQFYSREFTDVVFEKITLDRDLRKAISEGEFALYYQPIVCMKTEKVIGAEALIRWNHPLSGMVTPDKFIPFSEESGLIYQIGKWVLRSACIQFLKWKKIGLGIEKIAINVAGYQIKHIDFVDEFKQILYETQCSGKNIEVEISEDFIMKDNELTIEKLIQLKSLGMKIAIDDFGTGYSSLNYLKKLPVDILKIDKSFVKDLSNNLKDKAIIQTIMTLGKLMSMELVVEGVETLEQRDYIIENGCEFVQGFFYSKPLNVRDFEIFVKENNKNI